MSAKKVTGRADAAPTDPGAGLPAVPMEFVGVKLTPYQSRMKSRFWSMVRDDPLVDPSAMSGTEIAHLLREPRVASWLKDPQLRQVFLNEQQWLQNLEWLHELWTERALEVLLDPTTENKDIIALGRELAKMTGRSGPADAVAAGASAKQFTPEQAKKAIEQAASQMGWTPPALPASPQSPPPAEATEELPQ